MDQSNRILATDSANTDTVEKQGIKGGKRIKLESQYIYQTLFKEKRDSDIEIKVLGRVWNLHKIYLEKSPYFKSMLNGSWRESSESSASIQIDDERTDVDALDAVFGSLYSDEIDISPKNVTSILATATIFLMESIIGHCAEVMIENINRENVIDYYECACLYNCINVKKKTFEWLEINLVEAYSEYCKPLTQASIELMTSLVSSSDLFVCEFSLYKLLRTWIYLRLNPDYDPDQPQTQSQQKIPSSADGTSANTPVDVIRSYFVNRSKSYSFLATSNGQPYIKPFQALRTQYLVTSHTNLNELLADNIIPKEWVHSHALSHWHATLKFDKSADKGPRDLKPEVFFANCMRCSCILTQPAYQSWYWSDFSFGLYLQFIFDSGLLKIRRYHGNEYGRLLSTQAQRHFMVRVSIASIDAQRQPVHTQRSDILSLSLKQNEEAIVLTLDKNFVHPLLISINLLVVSPTLQTFKEQLLLPPSEDVANSTLPISTNCHPPV